MLKASQNPPVLSPWVDTVTELPGRWWVAHTKARNEKAFAWDLHDRGIGYFIPLQTSESISGGRKRRTLTPFFPSYVFVNGDDGDRRAALTTGRICQTLEVFEKDRFVAELANFELAMAEGVRLEPLPDMMVGNIYRITSGPFIGIEGPATRIGKTAKIALRISSIAQGGLLEVDADVLEPIEEAPNTASRPPGSYSNL